MKIPPTWKTSKCSERQLRRAPGVAGRNTSHNAPQSASHRFSTHSSRRGDRASRVPLVVRIGRIGALASSIGIVSCLSFLEQPAFAEVTGLETRHIFQLTNWLELLALAVCTGGIIISAALWAIGSKGQNPGQELTGKKGLIVCATAALFIGALPGMVSYFDKLVKQNDTTGISGSAGLSANCLVSDLNARWQKVCEDVGR